MLDFIESVDSGKLWVPEEVRDFVLTASSDTMKWKKLENSSADFKERARYLDSLMSKVVSQIRVDADETSESVSAS